MATEIASLYARIGADTSDFDRGIGSAHKALNSFGSAVGLGLKAAVGVGVAAVGGLTAAIGVGVAKAKDMEQQLADIASVLNITTDAAAPLKKLIQDLGIDPKLKVSATEAAAAIEMLARNGLTMDEILQGAARSTVLLANATNADFAVAANVATDAMAQFNISAEDMNEAVNGIAAVTVNSKFDINDYSLALAQAGGVAASVGVDFDDFNATIAAISPLFASGSDAGTSFKTFLQRLVPNTEKARGVMGDLGIITAAGGNAFFTASGEMKSMAEIAGILNAATVGLSEEQKNQAFSTMFGTDAMRAAFAIAGMTEQQFLELKATMGNVDAEEMAATRMNTFAGQLEILGGIIDGLLTQIGDAFLPILKRFTAWAIDITDKYGPAVVEWFASFAGAIEKAIDWMNGMYEDGSSLAKDFLLLFPDWLRPIVQEFGVLIFWIRRTIATMGDQEEAINHFQMVLASLGDIMRTVFDTIVRIVRENWPRWAANLLRWATAIGEWAGGLWNDWVLPKLTEFWEWLQSWVTDPMKRQQLFNAIDRVWTGFASWAGGLWNDWVLPKLTEFWKWLQSWVTDPERRQELLDNIKQKWTSFREWAGDIWAKVWPKLTEFWTSITSWVTDPNKRQELLDNIKQKWTSFTEWAGDTWANVQPKLAEFWTSITSWVTDPNKRQELIDNVKEKWVAFTQWANDAWTNVQPKLEEFWGSLKTWLDDNADGLGTKLETWAGKFAIFGQSVLDGWKEQFPQIEQYMEGFVTRSEERLERLKTAFQEIFGDGSTDGELAASGRGFGRFLVGFATGVGQFFETLAEGFVSLAEAVGSFRQAFDAISRGDWGAAGSLLMEGIRQLGAGIVQSTILGALANAAAGNPTSTPTYTPTLPPVGSVDPAAAEAARQRNALFGRIDYAYSQGIIDSLERNNYRMRVQNANINDLAVLASEFVSKGFASGGYAQAGQGYLVGEKGPEWFQPGQAGYVYNAEDTQRMGGQTIWNINLMGTGNAASDVRSTVMLMQALYG